MSYIPLANITLTSSQSSVTFGSIPTSVNGVALRDLVCVYNGTGSTASNILISVNGNTSNLSFVQMGGTGSGSGYSGSGSGIGYVGEISSNRCMSVIQIMDYSATDKHKTILARDGQAQNRTQAAAIRWGSTNAVTSFSIYVDGAGTISSGSTFALYGVAG